MSMRNFWPPLSPTKPCLVKTLAGWAPIQLIGGGRCAPLQNHHLGILSDPLLKMSFLRNLQPHQMTLITMTSQFSCNRTLLKMCIDHLTDGDGSNGLYEGKLMLMSHLNNLHKSFSR